MTIPIYQRAIHQRGNAQIPRSLAKAMLATYANARHRVASHAQKNVNAIHVKYAGFRPLGQTSRASIAHKLHLILTLAPLLLASPAVAQSFYRYENEEGRATYVSDPELIPPRFRPESERVDVRDVSTNQALGRELDQATQDHYEALVRSDQCAQARAYAEGDTLAMAEAMASRHAPILAIALFALGLLISAPIIGRRVGMATWARFLLFVLPMLAMFAAIIYVLDRTEEALDLARVTADGCTGEPPGAITRQAVQQLQDRLDRIDALTNGN